MYVAPEDSRPQISSKSSLERKPPGGLLVACACAALEAVDSFNREVTVKKPDGSYDALYVPASVKRFDTLKVGDKITATYYENIVLRVASAHARNELRGLNARSESSSRRSRTASLQWRSGTS
jgi:hypothetical protein